MLSSQRIRSHGIRDDNHAIHNFSDACHEVYILTYHLSRNSRNSLSRTFSPLFSSASTYKHAACIRPGTRSLLGQHSPLSVPLAPSDSDVPRRAVRHCEEAQQPRRVASSDASALGAPIIRVLAPRTRSAHFRAQPSELRPHSERCTRVWLGIRLGRFSVHHVGFARLTERAYVRKTEYLATYRNTVKTEQAKLEADDDAVILRVRYTRLPSPKLLSMRTHSRSSNPPHSRYATPSPSRIARPWRYIQHAHATLSVLRPARSRSTASYGVRGLQWPSIEIGPCRPLQGRLEHWRRACTALGSR
ncbi:hypothetical protein VTO73DRAFT_13104 [Trametes versicolor]